MTDLVSVVIPTYKRPFDVLMKAVNSVLEQTYKNLEIIIVDDNPKNNQYMQEIEKGLKEKSNGKIIYIQHEFNQGACTARNTGIEQAQGVYVAFLDDDDEWLPQKIELQLEKFNDPKVGLVYCDSFSIIVKKGSLKKKLRIERRAGWVFEELLINNFIGSTSFVMLRKETLSQCGVFNENLKSSQDFELWLRIAKKYKVDFVDKPLVNYYIHEGERISTNPENKIQGLETINKLNKEYLKENPKIFNARLLKLSIYYVGKYGFFKALKKWYEAFKICPFCIRNFEYLMKILKVLILSYLSKLKVV